MVFHVHHINKKTGITYVYEAVSVWNKELKQARNKQVCIGKIDRVTGDLNNGDIDRLISRYAGFQAILSSSIKDPVETMRVYRDKDAVEKSFDDLKNSLDMKRLRMKKRRCC